jgi:leucyl aminopeptidase
VKISVSAEAVSECVADAVVVPVFAGQDCGPGVAELGLTDVVARSRFAGRDGDELLIGGRADDPFRSVLLIGLGADRGVDGLRRGMERAVRRLGHVDSLATTLPQVDASCVAAVAEGALLGGYGYHGVKSDPEPPVAIQEIILLVGSESRVSAARRAVEIAEVVGGSVAWARDLVNTPPCDLTPMDLAAEAVRMSEEVGLSMRVHELADLRRGGFGGILAVGAGSTNPPCLIEARYPGRDGRMVGLVGKGITFDAGGLQLKSKTGMADMKTDMAGGAAMLATVRAAALLDCPTGVLAIVPAAENLPGGHAYRPSDVVRHRGGTTSEVVDTDAEGRLVLADALAYLAEQEPDAIVDAATLTYDVVHALGDQISGILGSDRALVADLIAAGAAVGEPFWELPLWAGYRRNIDSPVADLRNDGGSYADAIHAGLFLAEFTGGLPWAHLDIAGTAYDERPDDHMRAGATGVGVRTLVHWLMSGSQEASGADDRAATPGPSVPHQS